MSNLSTALSGIISNVSTLAEKVTEVKVSVENKVPYVSDDKGRTKSILLNNNEMILGSSVDNPPSGGFIVEGGADNHNLIMVNKWNVVDVGSPKVPLTLNAYSGVVKINDEKVVATVDQIPVVDGIAAEASGAVVDFLGVQEVDGKVRFSQDKFPGMYSVTGYTPAAGDFVYLNNNAKIASDLMPDLEILLDGIFIGKDYGNLSSQGGKNQTLDNIVFHASAGGIAINAANGLVYIPTSEYESPSALVAALKGMQPAEQLAFIENHRVITVDGKIAERAIPDTYATVDDVATTLEDYATKTEVDEKISAIGKVMTVAGKVDDVSDLPSSAQVGSVYLVPEGDETAEYVFTADFKWEKLGTTTKVDLSGYATETFVSNAIADKADKSEVATSLTEAKEYADEKDVTTLDEAKAFANNKFVEKEIVGTLGVAKVWNEVTGGGAMFTRTDGVKSFVGVNQGNGETSRDVNAQIYAIDSNSVGTRLNIYKDGITYAKNLGKGQQDIENHPELELAVKGDVISGVAEAKTYTDSAIETVNTSLTDILAQIAELKAKIENV